MSGVLIPPVVSSLYTILKRQCLVHLLYKITTWGTFENLETQRQGRDIKQDHVLKLAAPGLSHSQKKKISAMVNLLYKSHYIKDF